MRFTNYCLAIAPLATPRLPQVQVWMLKAHGTVVSRNAGSSAFPAAIVVDGVYYIQQLQTF